MKLNECCYRSLKHGFAVCPECRQALIPYGPQQTALIFAKEKQK